MNTTANIALNVKVEQDDAGTGFVAWVPFDYHCGYGPTPADAVASLKWSMANE